MGNRLFDGRAVGVCSLSRNCGRPNVQRKARRAGVRKAHWVLLFFGIGALVRFAESRVKEAYIDSFSLLANPERQEGFDHA